MPNPSIGQRVAIARRRRGLSQAVLANLIGRSESWLSQVERGIRSVDRLTVLMDLADVLHVDVESLLGRPWKFAPNGSGLPNELEPTRRYLNGYKHLFDALDQVERVEPLAVAVQQAHIAYQAAHYGTVAASLPTLLARTDLLAREATPRRMESASVYVSGYISGREVVAQTRSP